MWGPSAVHPSHVSVAVLSGCKSSTNYRLVRQEEKVSFCLCGRQENMRSPVIACVFPLYRISVYLHLGLHHASPCLSMPLGDSLLFLAGLSISQNSLHIQLHIFHPRHGSNLCQHGAIEAMTVRRDDGPESCLLHNIHAHYKSPFLSENKNNAELCYGAICAICVPWPSVIWLLYAVLHFSFWNIEC